MKYSDWKKEQEDNNFEVKCFKLFKADFCEKVEVDKLPELEEISYRKDLTFFKDAKGYGYFGEKSENGKVYGYDLFYIDNLTDEEANEVLTSSKNELLGKVTLVFEVVGYILAFLSLTFFLFVLLGAFQSDSGSDYAAVSSLFYASGFFTAFVVSIVLSAVCRITRCKNTL